MRRAEREIKDREAIEDILRRATVCRLAVCDGNVPYVVPLSFGYADNCLYFHSAREGRKIETIKANP
ncbi:MAG: pyridoxamine 5'-phosphate oxidase family protein, partial [Anaerolineae bacterium]|nr:pyridoxamine 5'-phosphate oxidase family protein [Anaerolineae bacterium]